ncbi:MAG: 4-hydroxy-3-methylbut-2-enyl diphosphate reductase [Chlamydiae bacterium]|nr:4-hydroxy-3-methylbut-2-enyl diphosphate reductase [Chlamydiota bacterium]MBI3276573.1 4-hydroxy-3-methylbut-2-enyl diphosphate reductase [Chlamydiota bacterium]
MPQINIARHGGFCFGVKLAVNAALKASGEHDNVVMLGDIVHNEHVVQKIDNAGVKVVEDLEGTPKGTLLLRAHGSTPQVYDDAKRLGFNILDATCPLVLEIHEIVRELDKEGFQIVVIGDHGHDEVRGIAAQVKNAIVISKPEEVPQAIPRRIKKLGVVTQSTQNIDNVKRVIAELSARVGELKFVDTICGPTKAYQREIRHLPLENDVMIIVGSFKSANTCRLTEISLSLNPRSHQVESPEDVKLEWFQNARTIGVSAGASTPDWIIQEVVNRLKELTQSNELI